MNKKTNLILSIIIIAIIGITIFFINQLTMINDKEQSNNSINNKTQNNMINTENSIESNNKNQIGESNLENIINPDITENNQSNEERMENMKLYIKVNNRILTATLNDNSSARALVNKLENGPITIDMEDYSKMEKVGSLGFSLPRNDESINTEAGDLILYQGNSFVIYYDNNSWSLTRLGKIDNITQKELKEIIGTESVKITLSIEE